MDAPFYENAEPRQFYGGVIDFEIFCEFLRLLANFWDFWGILGF